MTATILIIDDLEQNVKVLEAKLLSEYYVVLSANSGSDGIKMLSEHKVDLILLDVMMPEMDGFTTCRKIKANPHTMHIPIVMVTALTDIEDRVKGLEAGADEFLTKPIDNTALFARVRSLTRIKNVIEELKLRNSTTAKLGGKIIEFKDDFQDNRILLIDDDLIQAKNLQNFLLSVTTHFKVIKDSSKISECEEYKPDLIIISLQLNEDDPLRIGIGLRSNPAFKHSVIMLMTEEGDNDAVIKGMERGINDYFHYPVDCSELQARVKTQIRRKQYQDHLRDELSHSVNLSTKDGLTGVFNRRYFDIHLKNMIKKSIEDKTEMALMLLDMDDFKEINDTYGHQAGDEVLRQVGLNLTNAIRVTDLVARYGGEEFAILLGNIHENEALLIANKICKIIEAITFDIEENGKKKQLKSPTSSIGLSILQEKDDPKMLIKRADKALYEAKAAGKNRVILK